MTLFISSEYQKPQHIFPEQEAEASDVIFDRLAEFSVDFIQEAEGISDAFKADLLSMVDAGFVSKAGLGEALVQEQWPNHVTRQHLLIQAEEIWKLCEECAYAFLRAAPTTLPIVSRSEFSHWVAIGRHILESNAGAAELCSAYFQTSPHLIKMGANHFIAGWVEQNLAIASFSLKTALAFCRATPAFVGADRAFHLRKWAEKARQIVETGGCEEAAIAFIETSPRIVRKITFRELISWGGIGLRIAAKSPHQAFDYFSEPSEAINSLFNLEIQKFLDLTSVLVDADLGRAMDFYQRCPADLVSLNPNVRERVLDVSRKLAAQSSAHIVDVFGDIVSALIPLFSPTQEKVMEGEPAISRLSAQASRAYFRSVGIVLSEISEIFLPNWIEKGLELLIESEKSGIDYFSLTSAESRSELVRWKEAVLLENHKQAFSIFAHALSGRKLKLKQIRGPASKKGVSQRLYPAMVHNTVFLPAFFADASDRQDNFRLYKVIIAHQAGYMEFGTYNLLSRKIIALLESFPLSLLAKDIFFIIEDGRIDFLLRREYRGLKPEIDQTTAACMGRRSFPKGDPLSEALEILLRMTLGCLDEELISQGMRDWAQKLKKTMDGFFEKTESVWDSFQKAAELYESFSLLAGKRRYLPFTPMPFQSRPNPDYFAGDMDADAPDAIQGGEAGDGEGFHSMSEEEIKSLLEKMKSPKLLQDLEEEPVGEGLPITNIDGLMPVEAVDGAEEAGGGKERPCAVSSAKSAVSKGPFYYDEWDYQQRAYRRKWCTLREKTVPENDLGLFDRIYDNYSDLILKVKKQFQRIRPEVLEIVRRMEWGPEIDFNAMIQSVVDRKAGDSPSDRIFTRMEKKVRRISTLLLVDMSASTDRLVSLVNSAGHTSQGPSGNTLQGRAPLTDTQEKKIIDVEIEGLVVITEALQSLGDDYAIFGFSGYGREQVDFYSIKDFDENYSEKIKSRICGIQPQKGTRMGPAIRHAIEKLNQIMSDQRLLVLLSDGFPQDLNYGEDRSSKEYALYDTMMALAEAKMFGIRPFCITVDLAGDDYLRKMCNPDSYLIVKDVYSLPEVLPKVIESLVL